MQWKIKENTWKVLEKFSLLNKSWVFVLKKNKEDLKNPYIEK